MSQLVRSSFDPLVARLATARVSVAEPDLLHDSHWSLGDDARLRDDVRFRPTPWGRWMLSRGFLANEWLFARFHREPRPEVGLEEWLGDIDPSVGRRSVFCTADPRFVLQGDRLRLAAGELGDVPLLEPDATALERYTTHLPVHTLRAAAASAPAGEWGPRAQDEVVETLGWLRVTLPGRRLTPHMFVARVEGRSMDDGRSGLIDGGFAVFELWPDAGHADRVVLVRGAFSDPETGTYAVKRFEPDEPEAEAGVQRIRLVSLNPDKIRYPDIEVTAAEAAEVSVVAHLTKALAPGEYARRPKPVRHPGRRDLDSSEGRAVLGDRLARGIERFFEGLPADGEAASVDQVAGARLVCLEASAGGLHLEVGPLPRLPGFVRRLKAVGTDWEGIVLASNARQRPARVAVSPGVGPWTWRAPGFDDEPDLGLEALHVSALAANRVHVFRVDAAGVGRAVETTTLLPGPTYRLLVPPAARVEGAGGLAAHDLPGGWRLVEVAVSAKPAPGLVLYLRGLGLTVGEAAPRLVWALGTPSEWRVTPRGDAYPCFAPADEPVVAVGGLETLAGEPARLFLAGPGNLADLSVTVDALVGLGGLAPGRYAVSLLTRRTSVTSDSLLFEVAEPTVRTPSARARIEIGGLATDLRPGSQVRARTHDLHAIDLAVACEVLGPPLWPVRVSWQTAGREDLGVLHLDHAGHLDLDELLAVSAERWRRHRLGDMVLDFGELGVVVVPHERRQTADAIRAALRSRIEQHGSAVVAQSGAFETLLPTWFEPVCWELGYEVVAFEFEELPEPPSHVRACRLRCSERAGERIEQSVVRVLVLVEDLSLTPSSDTLIWIDTACARAGVRDALLSDGLRWAYHRRGTRLAPQASALREVIEDPRAFAAFLQFAAEGVG